jgi:hypothetical protein
MPIALVGDVVESAIGAFGHAFTANLASHFWRESISVLVKFLS